MLIFHKIRTKHKLEVFYFMFFSGCVVLRLEK